MRAKRTTCRLRPGCRAPCASGCDTMYQDKAAAAYDKVITRYPMAPHVEDARDRLVAMNRPVPEPTEAAIAESDAEERSRQPLHFTDKTLDIIKHGPTVVEAVHVGEPTLDDPKRILAPDVTKENMAMFIDAVNAGKPRGAAQPVRPPARTSRRAAISLLPLRCRCRRREEAPAWALRSSMRPTAPQKHRPAPHQPIPTRWSSPWARPIPCLPAAEKPAEAPVQVNDIKPGANPHAAVPHQRQEEEAQGRSE